MISGTTAAPSDPAAPVGSRVPLACDVRNAVAAIRRGEVAVLLSGGSGCGGGLLLAAETAAALSMAFLVRHSTGFVRVALLDSVADRLGLPLMCALGVPGASPRFTVAVDARDGVTTGISAADRSATLRVLADPAATAERLSRPGHIVPVRVADRGASDQRTYAEVLIDFMRLAELQPVAAFAELVSELNYSETADDEELLRFAARYDLTTVTVDEVTRSMRQTAERSAECAQPTRAA
jgi:3,4-dihydroxy 2-butanone 4-phosphate synthase / GTP cyclohydrolase II